MAENPAKFDRPKQILLRNPMVNGVLTSPSLWCRNPFYGGPLPPRKPISMMPAQPEPAPSPPPAGAPRPPFVAPPPPPPAPHPRQTPPTLSLPHPPPPHPPST